MDWSEQIHFQLGIMGLNLAIVSEKPIAITEASTEADKSHCKVWDRMSLNLKKMTMVENDKPSIPKMDNAREFMLKVKEYSQSDIDDKCIVGSLMSELTTKKFD